jgi:uncharacterized membrane protein YhaH (DUF805 family)
MNTNAAPGWYPVDAEGCLRWWDGDRWTDHRHPSTQPAVVSTATRPAYLGGVVSATPPAQVAPAASTATAVGTRNLPATGSAVAARNLPALGTADAFAKPAFAAQPATATQMAAVPFGVGAPVRLDWTTPAAVETPGFLGAYGDYFRNYATFRGRLSRGSYWRAYLMNALVCWGLVFLAIFGLAGGAFAFAGAIYLVLLLYMLIMVLPSLGSGVRRLHDAGYSGATVLLSLIPLVGTVILIILLAQPSNPGPNQYGPPPRT